MSLSDKQVEYLLRPIHPKRVLHDNKGMSHVSQQDIRAHLTRVFGFGGWSSEVTDLTLVAERQEDGRKGWFITYRATVKLTIRDQDGNEVASFMDVGTGTSPNLPTVGDGHDFASKVAVSMALKRCATNLGDGFGLSLYNKGQTAPLVIFTLVKPDAEIVDDLPQQVDMGHDDAGSNATLHGTADSPPLSEPVEPPLAVPGSGSPSESLPDGEPTTSPEQVAAQTTQQVEHLREQAIALLSHTKPKEALQKLTRLQLDAAKHKLMNETTTSPKGVEMSVQVLLNEVLSMLSRAS